MRWVICGVLAIWPLSLFGETRGKVAEYPNIVLSGPLWAEGRRSDISGQAAVCDMAELTPVYGDFGKFSNVIARVPPFALVMLTGRFSDDKAWVETSQILLELDDQGVLLPKEAHKTTDVIGWMSVQALCNFFQ